MGCKWVNTSTARRGWPILPISGAQLLGSARYWLAQWFYLHLTEGGFAEMICPAGANSNKVRNVCKFSSILYIKRERLSNAYRLINVALKA